MRGNPLFRTALLAIALCLTSVLVASVIGLSRPQAPISRPVPAEAPSSLVPTFLGITLSAPAKSLSFTEPSGRLITVPLTDQLSLYHQCELAIDDTDSTWSARLSVAWQDPSAHHFARLQFEPHKLKTATLVLDFQGDTTDRLITTSFSTR